MRILIASPYLPWPLRSGGNAAQFSTLQCLSEDHQFTLVCPIWTEIQEAHGRKLAEKLPNVRVRTVFCGPPESKTGKILKTAKLFARELLKGPYPNYPGSSPAYPFAPPTAAFVDALAEELKRGADLFQAEFAEMMSLALWAPPTLPKLFIHHQIHFVYAERFLKTFGANEYSRFMAGLMRAQEALYLSHFDTVVTFSEADRVILSALPSIPPVSTSPFPIPSDVGIASEIPPAFDGRFLFLGSQEHEPNREALAWLLSEIWPTIIARLPSSRLIVIGPWNPNFQKTIKARGVSFAGFVPDLNAVIRGGTMLVPLRVGSGIRTKILAALAQGRES